MIMLTSFRHIFRQHGRIYHSESTLENTDIGKVEDGTQRPVRMLLHPPRARKELSGYSISRHKNYEQPLTHAGGGSWHPEPQPLGRLRTNIDQHPEQLKNVLMNDRMRKEYLGGAPKVAQKVVKAFVTGRTNAENALKTRPQVSEPFSLLRVDVTIAP